MPIQLQQLGKRPETTGRTSFPAPAPDVVKCREMSVLQTKTDGTNPSSSAGKPLSPRQRAAVQMLVAGKTADAVARELGVDPRTVFRWKKLPGFNDAIEQCLLELRTKMEAERSNQRPRARAGAPARLRNPIRGSGAPWGVPQTPASEPQRRPGSVNFDLDDEDDDDEVEFIPTEKDKQDVEKLFASIGYTPTWKRGLAHVVKRLETS